MKDLYQKLLDYYRFKVGLFPMEESVLAVLEQTFTNEELVIFFMIPFIGYIQEEELQCKAAKAGVQRDKFYKLIKHMVMESLILRYTTADGQAFERGNIIYMTEQQVRRKDDFPAKQMYAEFFRALTEGFDAAPKTSPNFRAIPVESSINKEPGVKVFEVNMPVADPRSVLPLDIASEMIKAQPLIAVANCYCRSARKIVDTECGHLMETCFAFNEFAEALINAGTARRLDVNEALTILKKCEEDGLVHFIDNVESHPKVLCNCCECACILLRLAKHGNYTGGGPSRFIAVYEEKKCLKHGLCKQVCPVNAINLSASELKINSERCLGCGLCVSRCPEGALRLIPREKYPQIFPDRDALDEQICNEIERRHNPR